MGGRGGAETEGAGRNRSRSGKEKEGGSGRERERVGARERDGRRAEESRRRNRADKAGCWARCQFALTRCGQAAECAPPPTTLTSHLGGHSIVHT